MNAPRLPLAGDGRSLLLLADKEVNNTTMTILVVNVFKFTDIHFMILLNSMRFFKILK
jgi:hypothetical protein